MSRSFSASLTYKGNYLPLLLGDIYKLIIQIPPGVWYFGLFNGIGPTRTQSKMVWYCLLDINEFMTALAFYCNSFSIYNFDTLLHLLSKFSL